MVNKVTFVVLWRWSPQSLPLRSAPGYKYLLWFCKKNDKLNTTHDFLNCLLKTRHAEIHPNGFIALWIMLTCPVTVARAEKSFSWSKPSAGLLWQIEDFILIRHVVSRSIMCSLALDIFVKAFAKRPVPNHFDTTVTLFIIFSWLLLCNIFHVCYCATLKWFLLFCCMTTVRPLSIPAIDKWQRQLNHDE